MAIRATIGGVEVGEYLKGLDVVPGGDGNVGSGRLYLNQEAGGLDLRPMQLVQVWKTHTGDAGIATKGRIFGGHINVRNTGNVGTTKLWALNCWDHSILLHKLVRDRQPALAVVLTADTFGAQISTLIQQIQRNGGASVRTAIEATIRVADLYPTMPAVTYPGGHKLGWYIQQLCDTVHLLDDTIFPHFYMDVSNSYGILESFDTPYLVVFDGAQLPAASHSFSDVVAGGRKPIFGTFKRVTDATAMSQRRQSRFGSGLVVTSENNVSQALYPCEYINHGDDPGGNSGKWMNETFEDSESVSFAAAQARIDAIVASESTPRETFEFETPERVLPGETIGLGWSLDGIADDTEYTVAKVQVKIEPPDVLWSKLTVNARRIGLFDNNLSVFAAPIEGDDIPPLPPASASVTSNTFNWDVEAAELVLLIGVSPSPDASGYVVVGTLTSPTGDIEPYEHDVGLNLTPSLYAEPGYAYSLRVHAYDNAANRSDPFPAIGDAALTGTTALPSVPAPTGLQVDTARGTAGYVYRSGTQAQVYISLTPPATLPDYYIFRMGADGASPALWTPHIVHRDTTSFLVPDVLATGSTYDGDIVAVRGSIRSSVANMSAFTVPAYAGPPAPVLVSVSVGVAPKSGGYARVRLTSSVTVGGGYAFARRLTGDLTDVPIISVAIPPDFASPYFAIFNNLTVGASYEFSAIVFDELGVENPVPSNTIQATITYVPDPDVEDSSFDVSFPDDDGLRGWEVVEGDGLDIDWSQSVTYDGRTSLVILDTNSTHSAFAGPLYAAKGSETIAIKQAQRRSTGTGSAPNARMEVWEYDDADVKTETTLYDVLSTTSFVLFDGKHALLSSTRYFRIMLQAQNNGGSGYSVYFSPPRIRRQVDGKDLASTLDLDEHTVTLSGTGKILAGGGKVTVGADGITVGGSSGADNIDFVNEVDVQVGSLWAGGSSGNGSINLIANYNGAGSTTLSIGSVDEIAFTESAHSEIFTMNSAGFTFDPGATTRRHLFTRSSMVIGDGLATNATDGFVYLGSCAGVPTGVPTTQTGTIPFVIDSTNNHVYAYMGGAWQRISLSVADKARLDRIHTPVSKTATFTADLVSGAYLVSASGGAVVANLPAVSGNAGLWYFIKKTDSSTNTVTIEPSGAEVVDGAANLILYTQDHAAIIYCDGATWWVFGTLGVTWRGHRINGTLAANGGLSTSTIAATRISKTAAFTAASETVYECDATSAAFTATLPSAASTTGRMYTFKKVDSSANKITIDGNSSETIDQIITYPLIERNQSVTIQSNGTNWNIIGQVGLILESDGTRWLGPEIALNFNQRAANLMPWSADDYVYHIGLRGDFPQYLKRWTVDPFVSGTNDGSNYWNIRLYMQSTNVASVDTSAVSGGDWRLLEATSFSTNPSVLASHKYLEVEVAKTGSPGVLYMTCVLYVRLVYS